MHTVHTYLQVTIIHTCKSPSSFSGFRSKSMTYGPLAWEPTEKPLKVHLCLHENGKSMKGDDLLNLLNIHGILSMSVSLTSCSSEMSKEGDSKHHK